MYYGQLTKLDDRHRIVISDELEARVVYGGQGPDCDGVWAPGLDKKIVMDGEVEKVTAQWSFILSYVKHSS